jgi:hypothetical protein
VGKTTVPNDLFYIFTGNEHFQGYFSPFPIPSVFFTLLDADLLTLLDPDLFTLLDADLFTFGVPFLYQLFRRGQKPLLDMPLVYNQINFIVQILYRQHRPRRRFPINLQRNKRVNQKPESPSCAISTPRSIVFRLSGASDL